MDIKLEKKRGIQKKHIPYIVGGGIVLSLFLMIIFSSGNKRLNVDGEMLNVSTVNFGVFNEYIRITGLVQPKTTIQLSPLEGGIVTEFVVEEGAMVQKGDVIVRLTNSHLNLDILNTEALLAENENSLRDTRVKMEQEKLSLQQEMAQLLNDERRAKRRYLQYKRLNEEELVSKEEFIQAEEDFLLQSKRRELVANRQIQDSIYRTIQVDNMEGSLRNMKKNMVLTYERLDNLNVKSPISGQLGSIDVLLGQSIPSGHRIGQVNDLSSYKIQANIDEHYIDRVINGLAGSLERGGDGFKLIVNKVYPEVNGGKFKTDLLFTSELPENIRAGQTYYINLATGTPDKAMYIPRGSFFQTTGGNWIFVVSKDGSKALRRPIKIGKQNPQFYEVIEGLSEGERVVTSSYELFGDSEELILKGDLRN